MSLDPSIPEIIPGKNTPGAALIAFIFHRVFRTVNREQARMSFFLTSEELRPPLHQRLAVRSLSYALTINVIFNMRKELGSCTF